MAAKPDRRLLICANPKCDFLVHEDEQFGGFCCKRCHWCLERDQPPEHGEKCCRLPAPPDAVRAELTPPELPMSVLRAKNRNKRPKKQAVLPEGQAVSRRPRPPDSRRPRPPDKPPPPPPSGGGGSASASAPARKSRRADTREKYLDEKDDEHRESSHDGRKRMRTQRRSRSTRSRSRSRNSGESQEASREHRRRRTIRRRRCPREGGRDGKDRLAHKSSGKAQDGDRAAASDRRQAGGHASRRSEGPPQKSTPAPQAVKPDTAPSKADSIIVGDKVEIFGMSKKPKLNGMLGKVVEVHEEPKGRKFDVRIMNVPGNSREQIQGVLRKVGAAYLCKVAAETT